MAFDRIGYLRLLRTLSCALVAGAGLGCAQLDTADADRCATHEDCRSGRACQDNRCVPIAALDAVRSRGAGSSAPPRADDGPDGGRSPATGRSSAPPSSSLPPGDAGMDGAAESSTGAAGGSSGGMDAGMDGALIQGGSGGEGGDGGGTGTGDAKPPEDGKPPEDAKPPEDDADPESDGGGGGIVDPCVVLESPGPEVALWLDASRGVVLDGDGRVEAWTDRTVHQHVARPIGDSVNWPVLIAEEQHGHPGVQFGMVGSGPFVRRMKIADHPSLQFGTAEFALIVVLRHRTPIDASQTEFNHGAIFAKPCNCSYFPGVMFFANDVWPEYLGTGGSVSGFNLMIASRTDYSTQTLNGGFNDNRIHVVVGRRVRDEVSVDIDGAIHAVALASATLNLSNPGVDVNIGGHLVADLQALEGEMFELLAITGPAARNTDVRVECLMRKYGLR